MTKIYKVWDENQNLGGGPKYTPFRRVALYNGFEIQIKHTRQFAEDYPSEGIVSRLQIDPLRKLAKGFIAHYIKIVDFEVQCRLMSWMNITSLYIAHGSRTFPPEKSG